MLTPVRAKLGQTSTRKNEGGCREAGEIAVEGSDGLSRPEESATHHFMRGVFATERTDLEEGTPAAASSCCCATVLLRRIHDVWSIGMGCVEVNDGGVGCSSVCVIWRERGDWR